MANSNPNTKGLKPFKKNDARINRNGRPKSFDALRKLAQQVAAEVVAEKDGVKITRINALLLAMSTSKNAADRRTFLEYAYGKVSEHIDMTSDGERLSNISDEEKIARIMALIDKAKNNDA